MKHLLQHLHLMLAAAFSNTALAEPYGYVAYNDSSQCTAHKALPACFGPRLPVEELTGYLVKVTPPDACSAVESPPAPRKAPKTYIALIQARDCSFAKKVLHAQQAGYQIAVVHNMGSEQLMSMNADDKEIQRLIKIPSLFTGQSVSLHLQRILQCERGAHVRILPPKRYLSHCEDSAEVLQGTLLTQDFRDMLYVVPATLSVLVALSWYKRAHKTKLHTYKQGNKYTIYMLCKAEYREGDHLRKKICFFCKELGNTYRRDDLLPAQGGEDGNEEEQDHEDNTHREGHEDERVEEVKDDASTGEDERFDALKNSII